MSLEVAIVGLPNVGKSSLFNALTSSAAESSAGEAAAKVGNFPFTTIEPNVGIVEVPDKRLEFLTKTFNAAKTVPTTIRFVDVAGLVKGASSGEGLGNKFLSHIRSCDAIAEVVRCFNDPNVSHVHGEINPDSDIKTINTELLLADLEQAEKALAGNKDRIKRGDKEAIKLGAALEQVISLFNEEKPLRIKPDLVAQLKEFQFLTAKPLLYIANISEAGVDTSAIDKHAQAEGAKVITINVKAELEIVDLPEEEQEEFRAELGMESGLAEVIKASYQLLKLRTFLTAGPKEVRAWTISEGAKAPQAAGKIHTDFEKGFIRAQVYAFEDIERLGSEKEIKEAGKMRSEGKEYVVKDGDVIEFLFNV